MVHLRVVLLLAVAVAVDAAPAAAQVTGLPRGTQGLFGGSRGRDGGQALDITVSLAEGYDTDLFIDQGRIIDAADERTGGFSTVFIGSGDYRLPIRRDSLFRASLASELRYYPILGETRSVSHRAAVGLSSTLPGSNTVFLNQRVRYSPSYYNYNLPQAGPDDPQAGDIDTGSDYASVVNLEQQYYYTTTASLTRPVTRRTSLALRADLLLSDFVEESENRRDSSSRVVSANFTWPLSRRMSATAGYRFRDNDIKNASVEAVNRIGTVEHTANMSVDWRPRLSASRDARISLRIGVSNAEVPIRLSSLPVDARPPDAEGLFIQATQNAVTAGAAISFPFTRGWRTYGSYDRGLTYVGLVEPLYSDSVSAGVDGMLTRRIRFLTTAGYSHGASAFRNVVYTTYTGNAGLNIAMSNGIALYTDYQYYAYTFNSSFVEEARPDLGRHTVRAGFVLFMPTLD